MNFKTQLKGQLKGMLCAAAMVSASAQAAILTNGDFEAGGTGVNTNAWAVSGWSHTGNVFLIGPFSGAGNGEGFWYGAGSLAQDGSYAVAFNAGDTSPNGSVWQTFATVSGQTYQVAFNYGASSTGSQTVAVSVLGANGSTTLASYSAYDANASYPSKLLNSYSFSFVADGNQASLRFADTGNYTFSQDGVLDNVVVTAAAVPEPMTGLLVGIAATALLRARRRT